MNVKPVWKFLAIVFVSVLTVCSAVTCYFDLDGSVEVKDIWRMREYSGENGFVIMLPRENELPAIANGIVHGVEDQNSQTQEEIPPVVSEPPLPSWQPSGEYTEIDRLILVNKEYPVDQNYIPADLVQLEYRASNRSAEWQVMTREAADAFNQLCSDALLEGYEIVVTTAYRSYEFQSYLYNSYVEKDGQAAADMYSAQPGKSEHQTGLAADVSSPSVQYRLTSEYGDTAEGKWLSENCYKYGFILRYPKGKEEITGYIYEPWHIRYVGQEAAKEIWETGVALEEYLGKVPDSMSTETNYSAAIDEIADDDR